jgi:hypothetical protein
MFCVRLTSAAEILRRTCESNRERRGRGGRHRRESRLQQDDELPSAVDEGFGDDDGLSLPEPSGVGGRPKIVQRSGRRSAVRCRCDRYVARFFARDGGVRADGEVPPVNRPVVARRACRLETPLCWAAAQLGFCCCRASAAPFAVASISTMHCFLAVRLIFSRTF